MTLRLADLPRCFQGITPAVVATCSSSGEPNVTYASHVYFIDEGHVALSRQFFNKTAKNVSENPFVCVQLYDSLTFDGYELDLRFDHSETWRFRFSCKGGWSACSRSRAATSMRSRTGTSPSSGSSRIKPRWRSRR